MKIDLKITELSTEQSDVLDAVVATANASLAPEDTPLTVKTFLERLVSKSVDSYVQTAFNESLLRAGSKLRDAPYDLRKALIQQVEAN